jgi:hypothetical protein
LPHRGVSFQLWGEVRRWWNYYTLGVEKH